MCTLSFLPALDGFRVAINRDEKRTRDAALPPEVIDLDGRHALFPSEKNGGTWIATNDTGVCVALINWHRIHREPHGDIVSRGQIPRTLAGKTSSQQIAEAIAALPLENIRPFRLMAFLPTEQQVTEWQWNLERLASRMHPWERRHWFSSGFDELRAEKEREEVCQTAFAGKGSKGANILRELHKSHAPGAGPFSICMHRPDAVTVSYTEVEVSQTAVAMRYQDGSPCKTGNTVTKTLARRRR